MARRWQDGPIMITADGRWIRQDGTADEQTTPERRFGRFAAVLAACSTVLAARRSRRHR